MFIEGIVPVLLKLAPVVLTLGGLGAAIRETLLKYRARSDLSKAISRTNRMSTRFPAYSRITIWSAANVVRKYATHLPPGEKNEVEICSRPAVDKRARGVHPRCLHSS